MKLRSWLSNGKDEQSKEPVEVGGLELDADGEVLESGFDLEQFEEDIENREDAIDELQRDVDRHEKKKKRAIDKARKAETQADKREEMVEAKEHKVAKEKKQKILDHLRKEKLTLKQLKLQHLQNNIGDGIDADLDIYVGELPVSEIEDAIEDASDDLWEAIENMEEIDDSIEMADEETSGLDLSDIEAEVEGRSNDEEINLSERSLETEDEIDQAIEEELGKLEDMQ